MNDVLLSPVRLSELESLIEKSVQRAFATNASGASGPHQEAEDLLTIQEAGSFLKLSVQTLYGYVQRASIPVSKKGGRLYFSRKDLISWVKEGKKKTTSDIQAEADQHISNKKGSRE